MRMAWSAQVVRSPAAAAEAASFCLRALLLRFFLAPKSPCLWRLGQLVGDSDLQQYPEKDSEMMLAVAGADGEKLQDLGTFCRDIKRQLHDIRSSDIGGG